MNSTATTASQNADTANGNVQTTWTALWDASKGNTGAPSANKTISDVKAAVGEVRNTGISADGKAQDTIDGLYSAVMGGDYTGMPADYVKPSMTGLTYTERNNVATGSNLVVDPGGENASYWTQTGVTQNTNATYVKSGSRSLQLTAGGSARTLFFNTIDTGAIQPYFVRQSEIYYVECYLRSATSFSSLRKKPPIWQPELPSGMPVTLYLASTPLMICSPPPKNHQECCWRELKPNGTPEPKASAVSLPV